MCVCVCVCVCVRARVCVRQEVADLAAGVTLRRTADGLEERLQVCVRACVRVRVCVRARVQVPAFPFACGRVCLAG